MATESLTNTLGPSAPLDARQLLLPYVLVLVGLCIMLQIAIAAKGSEIGLLASVLTGLIAVYYAAYLFVVRARLRRVRFAPLVAHAATYAVVCGSFQFHAAILGLANSDALRGDNHLPIDSGWFGPTFAMAGFWAIGLAMHVVASVAQRGYES